MKTKRLLLIALAVTSMLAMSACKKSKDKGDNATPQGTDTVEIPDDMEKTPSFELCAQSEEHQDILVYTGLDTEKTYTVIARVSEKDGKDEEPKYYTEADFQPESPDGSYIMDLAADMSPDKEYTCHTTLTEKGSSEEIEFTHDKIIGQDNVEFK